MLLRWTVNVFKIKGGRGSAAVLRHTGLPVPFCFLFIVRRALQVGTCSHPYLKGDASILSNYRLRTPFSELLATHYSTTTNSSTTLHRSQYFKSKKTVKNKMAPHPVNETASVSAAAEAEVASELSPAVVEIEETPKLLFAKLSEHASAPTKGSKLSAGYDIMSAYDCVVPKRGSFMVKTDIQIKLPAGTYGRIAPRSGLALKNKIDVGAGVVDSDYRGNIGVILFNHGDEDFIVTKGDRVAQLICEKICYPEVLEVKALDESERGEKGFGSTGVAAKKMKLDEDIAAPGVTAME